MSVGAVATRPSTVLTFTEAQLMQWLAPLLWPFLRVLALTMTAPVLSMKSIPTRVKIGFALLVTVAAAPSLPDVAPVPLDGPAAFERVAQQLLIGATLGFSARIVFAAVEFAGELVGLQMGLNFAGFFDPATGGIGNAAGRFFGTTAAWLFVVLDGHLLFTAAVVQSFQSFPVDGSPLAFLTRFAPQQWGREIFELGLWIALPVVGMLLLVNLVLGVASRVASQLNLFSVGFPLTLSIGLLGLMLSLPLMERPFTAALERMVALFQ